MTVFDDNAEDPNVEGDTDPRATLVGEGKKYKTEDEALKALLHSQQHIARLEQEARDRQSVEDMQNRFITLLEEKEKPKPQGIVQTVAEEEEPPAKAPSQDDLAKLVREITNQDRAEETRLRNVDQVSNKLIEVYGSKAKANEVIKQKAEDLGVSIEFLQQVAEKSPKAFYTQLGLENTPQKENANPTRSDFVATPQSGGSKQGTYSYYTNLRKENPALWSTTRIQREIMEAGAKHGPGWVNT